MGLAETAADIRAYFASLPEVRCASIYGSIAKGSCDGYSDIDIEVDVSGHDNGAFLKKAAGLLDQKYPVVFSDYAPSLLPDQYVVSCAISEDDPFLVVDLKCTAVPHVRSVTRKDIVNDEYTHILKLWVANLKHDLRGRDCKADIERMYGRLFKPVERTEMQMLQEVFAWLKANGNERYTAYLASCERYL